MLHSLADSYTLTEERKIDNLPVLATRRSDTSAMLFSKVNGLLLVEAFGNV